MLDPDKVLADVNGIKKARLEWVNGENYHGNNSKEFENSMSAKFPYLAENAKTLFTKCVDGSMEEKKLDMMLAMMRKVINGNKTLFDASYAIGDKLTDEYVKPLIADKK